MQKKALSIVWFLMAFMMLGYNIYMLDQIYLPPVLNVSELSELKSKLDSLSFLDSEQKNRLKASKELFKKLFACLPGLKNNKKIPLEDVELKELKEKIILPVVQGMLKSMDQTGKFHKLVMIDGKVYSEKEKVKGFVIEKILDNGIYLTRHGRKWFVKIPDVKFSIINE